MATMKDVAKKAGVGMGTVSRAINNSGSVKPETRERILKVIEELNYTPNEMARSFKKQKTKLIGLMVPMINHPFFAELSYYIEDELFKNGYKLMLCSSSTNRDKEIEYLQMLKKNQVDGIITISYHDIYQDEVIDLPIVTIDRYIGKNIPHVTSDNYTGGKIAAEHLVKAGCKKLAYVGGEPRYSSTVTDRRRAFVDVVRKADIPYVVFESTAPSLFQHHNELDYIDHVAEEFLKLYPDVDGILTSADAFAFAIIRKLKILGKRIPEDIKIIGYDGIPSFINAEFTLSTIKQPVELIGRHCSKILLDMIDGEEVPMHSVFPVEYIDGDTC